MAQSSSRSRRRRSMLAGTALLAVLACAVLIALTASTGLPWQQVTRVKASFADVGSLRAGDDVRLGNVRAGQVASVELAGDRPVVTMLLEGDRKVFRDASSAVVARSALGQKFVELNPGTAGSGPLPPGAVIASGPGDGAQDISDLLEVLDEPTRNALGSTLRETGGGAIGHSQDMHDSLSTLPGTLGGLGEVSRALNANSGTDLTRLLHTADDVATSFQGRQQQLGELAGHADNTLQAANVDGGKPLADSLERAPGTLGQVRTALHDLRGPLHDTGVAAAQLRPGAEAIGEATPDVRGVLREGTQPLEKVPGIAAPAESAVRALTGTLHDARPLAPRLTKALTSAQQPLRDIAPYSSDINMFFSNFASAMQYGDAAGHYLRIYPPVGPETATGLAPVEDPTVSRDAYPAPGEITHQREAGVLGERKGR
ncbi:MlaD family protein [Saccharopolyspora sp. SCSIO 74807]|uniref:MlaD family protein n=1 Tax=Saccharopolyspora sp. SCSIO 74807 TaxID=3118084 RepID=UPI0030D46331